MHAEKYEFEAKKARRPKPPRCELQLH